VSDGTRTATAGTATQGRTECDATSAARLSSFKRLAPTACAFGADALDRLLRPLAGTAGDEIIGRFRT